MAVHQYQPVQVAYFVNDIRKAATSMASTLGAGPFYVIENIQLDWCEHRGESGDFVHSSAYGQWGNVMLELVQQEGEGDSPFRDMYQPGEEGIHHVACFVDSIEDTVAWYEQRGFPLASRAMAQQGTEFAFIDTRSLLGHMLEIYVADEALSGFYHLVKETAEGWDGKDIFASF
jgi:hypothetical protein